MQEEEEVWVPYVGGFSNTGGQTDPQKELFGGTNFTYDWGNFLEIYIRGRSDAEFGKFGGYLCMFKGIGGAGPIAAIRGVGGVGGRPPVKMDIWNGIR